jgi:hypothetical protein
MSNIGDNNSHPNTIEYPFTILADFSFFIVTYYSVKPSLMTE